MPGYHSSPVQYSSLPYVVATLQSTAIPTFRFQPRRDGIDWRRFSAIDIERITREIDINTLQESINSITFCNLDGEKCPYCQQPVDPVLLKVLKMAQMIIEYLLYCQEHLRSREVQLEERLAEAEAEHERTKDELAKQAEEMKKVKEESKRRKKLIATQQLLLQAGANNYHKCQLCDKAFMNYSYLQGHVQRRHPEITETERQKKKQVEQMEDGIEELKSKLLKTQALLEEEREREHKRRLQEAEETRHREENTKRDVERWKEEERSKRQDEMDKIMQQFHSQLQEVTLKNSIYESRFHNLESKNSMMSSLVDAEERLEQKRLQEEMRNLKEEIDHQQSGWKKKLKEIQREHDAEKQELQYENERLKASMTRDQQAVDEQVTKQMQSLKSQIKEKSKLIKNYEQTIEDLSRSREVPQVAQVVLPVAATKDETSEDELDYSHSQNLKYLEDLRRNPDFIKQFRPVLEQTLIEKLESLGVKKGSKGINSSTHKNLIALLQTQLEQKIRKHPEIQKIRAKMVKKLTQKVKQWQKNEETHQYKFSPLSSQKASNKRTAPPSDEGTSHARSRNVLMVGAQQSANQAPVPFPRSKATGRQNAAAGTNVVVTASRTPPFTSEEDSMMGHGSFHTPSHKPSKETQQSSRPKRQTESDSDEWSDSDLSPGKPSPRSVKFSTGMTNQGSKVHSLAQSLERQQTRPRGKPVGGVDIMKSPPIKSPNKSKAAEKMQVSDESESEFSSLEEITEHLSTNEGKPQPAVRLSAESMGSQGTSIWSLSSMKGGGW
ncbi:zinc finger protein DZIP1L isoform X1 [Xenopus laevis]|uniref:Zinc finger protein DZIP1L isoform X1 n=1 Tax=Xenopus laevis TaxID=8355 RepID=A0A8J0VDM2_XENLA|nr:zinc finger protein DZIP1L isoform X1 [Xenopus laevis]